MIIHRMSTQAPEPPVKIYKVIALSFLFVTIVLLGAVIFITSKKVTITVLAKQDPETVSFTVKTGSDRKDDTISGKMQISEFAYSAEFSPTGNSQVEDVARGKVKIFSKLLNQITLVKTTRLQTPEGLIFRLSNAVNVPGGGEVTAEVYADKKGASYDIEAAKFIIPGLPPEKQKLVYAESSEKMVGGLRTFGVLTADDIEGAKNGYRQKLLEAYSKTLPEIEPGFERAFMVTDGSVESDKSVGEAVNSFRIFGTSTVVVAEYSKEDLSALVNREASAKIDSKSERYLSLTSEPKVSVQSFNATEGSAILTVRQEVAVTLDANSDKLSPDNFFGKKKDEIERYVMALDHVAGVDVKFTPSWVNTAPASADRVSVILKNIK